MAAAFLGLPILCTLNDGTTVEGTVSAIDPQLGNLSLKDGTIRNRGTIVQSTPSLVISRTVVQDIKLLSLTPSSTPAPSTTTTRAATATSNQSQSSQAQAAHTGTSSSSFTKREDEVATPTSAQRPPLRTNSSVTFASPSVTEGSATPTIFNPQPGIVQLPQGPSTTAAAYPSQQPQSLTSTSTTSAPAPPLPSKSPRKKKSKKKRNVQQQEEYGRYYQSSEADESGRGGFEGDVEEEEVLYDGYGNAVQQGGGKGSRQNRGQPRQHDHPPQRGSQHQQGVIKDGNGTGKNGFNGKHQQPGQQAANFEEDFDFNSGLQRFDKKKIFEELRHLDSTDPTLRLIYHNRNKPKGGPGMERLLNNENVLGPDEIEENARTFRGVEESESELDRRKRGSEETDHSADLEERLGGIDIAREDIALREGELEEGEILEEEVESSEAELPETTELTTTTGDEEGEEHYAQEEEDTDDDILRRVDLANARAAAALAAQQQQHQPSHSSSSPVRSGVVSPNKQVPLINGLSGITHQRHPTPTNPFSSPPNNVLPNRLTMTHHHRSSSSITSLAGLGSGGGGGGRTQVVTMDGRRCALVSLKQWKEVEKLANVELGPSLVQRVENAGRGLASLILQNLNQTHSLFSNLPKHARPAIAILSGIGTSAVPCMKGMYALRAGAHLVNKGCEVVVCLLGEGLVGSGGIASSFEFALRTYEGSGGRVVRSLHDLPFNPQLIIDAISDNTNGETFANNQPRNQRGRNPSTPNKAGNAAWAEAQKREGVEREAVAWANGSGIPVLSVDMPSGLGHETASPRSDYSVRPSFTACCGCIKLGCGLPASRGVVGDLYLLDLGISKRCFETAGVGFLVNSFDGFVGGDGGGGGGVDVRKYEEPFGSDWVVGCLLV